ncbi:MAG: penicillin-binding transpeptidase domain-containing protein [Anaerovorax sp.]
MAAEVQTSDVPIPAKRGSIYDRNGEELAISAVTYSVWARPASVKGNKPEKQKENIEKTAQTLSSILGLEEAAVKATITKPTSLVKVAKYIDKDKADQVRAKEIPGVEIAEDVKRYYPLGAFASHLLGSVTDDNRGLAGIEMKYNNYLSGLPGRWIKDTDRDGDSLTYGVEKYYKAENGLNVVLTLDAVIQHIAEKAIATAQADTQADMVECIVMDPKTGDVLAMAATPEYDPNNSRVPLDPAQAAYVETLSDEEKMTYWNKMWRNPTVSDVYEPGSTFKLLTTAIALEEGVTSLNDTFTCTGSIKVATENIKCWRYTNPHGLQTLVEAVGNSCNPVFVTLAQRVGLEKYFEYMDLFGMTERTGIDYPGEGYAILQKKETAWPVGLSTMSFGQGIAITPIQLITAISALGNDGKLMQPRLVKELTDDKGDVIQSFDTKTVRKIISKQTADEMCLIMEAVVDEGGSKASKIDGYRIGGKTGTAQMAENGVYSKTKYCSSSINMAPMDDPQIAVLVVVRYPKGAYYGSVVAQPASKQITQEVLRYLNIQPHYTQEQLQTMEGQMVVIPSVTGLNAGEAKAALKAAGLGFTVSPESAAAENFPVVDQYPKAGEKLAKEGVVCLYKE